MGPDDAAAYLGTPMVLTPAPGGPSVPARCLSARTGLTHGHRRAYPADCLRECGESVAGPRRAASTQRQSPDGSWRFTRPTRVPVLRREPSVVRVGRLSRPGHGDVGRSMARGTDHDGRRIACPGFVTRLARAWVYHRGRGRGRPSVRHDSRALRNERRSHALPEGTAADQRWRAPTRRGGVGGGSSRAVPRARGGRGPLRAHVRIVDRSARGCGSRPRAHRRHRPQTQWSRRRPSVARPCPIVSWKPFARVPGVTSASFSAVTPVSGNTWDTVIENPVGLSLSKEERRVYKNEVSPAWFSTYRNSLRLWTRLQPQRANEEPDRRHRQRGIRAAVLGGKNPIGQTIREVGGPNDSTPALAIVGVVKDAVYVSLRDGPTPTMYLPARLVSAVSVRAGHEAPAELISSVRTAIGNVNRDLSLSIRPLASDFAVFVCPRTAPRAALRILRRPVVVALGNRALRSRVLRRGCETYRNRDPNGAGSRPFLRGLARRSTGCPSRDPRRARRSANQRVGHAVCVSFALRPASPRPHDISRSRCGPDGRRRSCVVGSGSARGQDRIQRSRSGRVNRARRSGRPSPEARGSARHPPRRVNWRIGPTW